jgi:hypothetical protein
MSNSCTIQRKSQGVTRNSLTSGSGKLLLLLLLLLLPRAGSMAVMFELTGGLADRYCMAASAVLLPAGGTAVLCGSAYRQRDTSSAYRLPQDSVQHNDSPADAAFALLLQ